VANGLALPPDLCPHVTRFEDPARARENCWANKGPGLAALAVAESRESVYDLILELTHPNGKRGTNGQPENGEGNPWISHNTKLISIKFRGANRTGKSAGDPDSGSRGPS